ncbi:putative c6 transcription factor prf [Phaeomoniella chlamydospora]|uniref:Putative c6 transcription factor prf n=1 Tax=Phaeomoniella chlamydospora TaxID=158046 RepID=A0A0G2EQB0_PHACM|nr:putative c6 transcription factor prf [Phaeomoniella chlamydospora]
MITTLDLTLMNPFMCFSIYVACRVFIQYLKTVPNDGQARSSLRFLLTAMQTLDGISPLSNSFLAQLEVELEGGNLTGFRVKVNNDVMSPEMARMKLQNKTECSPLVSISEEQSKDPFTQPRPLMESQRAAQQPKRGARIFTVLRRVPRCEYAAVLRPSHALYIVPQRLVQYVIIFS